MKEITDCSGDVQPVCGSDAKINQETIEGLHTSSDFIPEHSGLLLFLLLVLVY